LIIPEVPDFYTPEGSEPNPKREDREKWGKSKKGSKRRREKVVEREKGDRGRGGNRNRGSE
jgi:hypothetical protein